MPYLAPQQPTQPPNWFHCYNIPISKSTVLKEAPHSLEQLEGRGAKKEGRIMKKG